MADGTKETLYDIFPNRSSIPSSFLSPRFQQLFSTSSVAEVRDDKCLCSLRMLNWQHLQELLPDERANDSEYFTKCAAVMGPWLCAVNFEIKMWTSDDFLKFYGEHVKWTGSRELIEECFLLSLEDGAPVLQALLMLTSVLERALGDVYLLKDKQCPSLLKDLLATPELAEMFSPFTMQFLRILIGPPISINIRNVAWHGFLSPEETHQRFCHILLAIIASLGHHLHHATVVNSIPHRLPVRFVAEAYGPSSLDLIIYHKALLQQLFNTNLLVASSMRPVWNRALHLLEEERYGGAMVLILPQLEMSCRLVFTAVNMCPQRLLTAESTEFFTTFDEMLIKYLPSGEENKLPVYLGEGIMNCFLDLLTYPEGPRIRDRISHGECDIPNFPAHLAISVLSLSAAICIKALPKDCDLIKHEALIEIRNTIDGYQSNYHPIKLLKKEILAVVTDLSTWESCPKPTVDQLEYKRTWESLEIDQTEQDWVDVALAICEGHSQTGIDPLICQPFSHLTVIQGIFLNTQISTLYRNQGNDNQSAASEEEVVGLCRRIMQHCLIVSRQVTGGLSLKYQQWEAKSLRSRQRNTYARMLDCIPDISSGIRSVLLFVLTIFISFEGSAAEAAVNRKQIRAMKQALQYVENLVTFTQQDKNRWEEAQKLTSQFYRKCLPLLK